jgi:hypothetical protein
MRPVRQIFPALATAALLATPVRAQDVVGRLPQNAIIQDLRGGQRLGVFAGWLVTGRDPVGVRAHSGPVTGLRYDVFAVNPIYFSLRTMLLKADHDVYLPNAPSDNNRAGTASANQFTVDASMEVALTGDRTWHGVQPLASVGMGVIAGVANEFDAGGYQPGVSPLFSFGLSVRKPVGRNGELRADFGWLVHQVRYPRAFGKTTAGDDVPLRAEGSMTPMTTNRMISLGWTWGVFR